jgi:hypothetical protein
MNHGEDFTPSARTLGKQSAGFFATKDHIDLKERLFSVFFVILCGYINFKTALKLISKPKRAAWQSFEMSSYRWRQASTIWRMVSSRLTVMSQPG